MFLAALGTASIIGSRSSSVTFPSALEQPMFATSVKEARHERHDRAGLSVVISPTLVSVDDPTVGVGAPAIIAVLL